MNDHRTAMLWRKTCQALRVAAARGLIISAMVGLFVFAALKGSAEAIETKPQPSLAACRLQIVSSDNQQNPRKTPVEMSRRRRIAKPLSHYQRDRGIDWRVPKNVNQDDPGIRCLLMCPSGPFIVDLQVLIDGLPFRMKREQVIDQAQADSKAKQRGNSGERADKAKSDARTTRRESTAVGRLVRYMTNQPDSVDRNEARWLLAQWTPGPALLELRDGFAAERATIAPVWDLLDRDQDGDLSADEFSSAEGRLINADSDGDEVVDMAELRRLTGDNAKATGAKAKVPARAPRRLLVTLGDHTDWGALFSSITELYASGSALVAGECEASANLIKRLDANDNQMWDADETSRLREITPDLTIRIRLGQGDNAETGLSVEQLSSAYGAAAERLRSSENSIVVEFGKCYLELSAAQLGGGSGNVSSDQVAIGAVMDGYPIWRHLDRNNDRRLSVRECKSVRAYLDAQDENQDGQLTSNELALPVRVSVTLGPLADQILQTPAPPVAIPRPGTENATAPPWFTLMDSNQDGDLSRSEFIGTRDQFKQLDQDGDALLSVKEVMQFDPENE